MNLFQPADQSYPSTENLAAMSDETLVLLRAVSSLLISKGIITREELMAAYQLALRESEAETRYFRE